MSARDENVTVLLNALDPENIDARNQLTEIIYEDLKRIAFNRLKLETEDNTYTVTALVHDAFVRLDKTNRTAWKNRKHFFGAVAETMRRILVERARYQKHKLRNQSNNSIEFDDGLVVDSISASDTIELDDALIELQKNDSELADIVKLKFYVGLSIEEIANIYECSGRTIDRQWQLARAWLTAEMAE
jgi:RNA polymerase sigma factor (TIGR02999 family)